MRLYIFSLVSWKQLHNLDNKTLVTLDTAKYVDYLLSIMFGIDCPSVHHALSRSTNKLNAFSIFRLHSYHAVRGCKKHCDRFFAFFVFCSLTSGLWVVKWLIFGIPLPLQVDTGCPTIEYSLCFGCFLGFQCSYRCSFYHFSQPRRRRFQNSPYFPPYVKN